MCIRDRLCTGRQLGKKLKITVLPSTVKAQLQDNKNFFATAKPSAQSLCTEENMRPEDEDAAVVNYYRTKFYH